MLFEDEDLGCPGRERSFDTRYERVIGLQCSGLESGSIKDGMCMYTAHEAVTAKYSTSLVFRYSAMVLRVFVVKDVTFLANHLSQHAASTYTR